MRLSVLAVNQLDLCLEEQGVQHLCVTLKPGFIHCAAMSAQHGN